MLETTKHELPRAKVLNLGLPKSGTTTLGQAMKHAGYRVADWRVRGRGYVGALMYANYFLGKDPLGKMGRFDAFSQMDIIRDGYNLWPQMDYGLLTTIREFHPTAKFLLSYREPEALSDSMLRWSNLGKRRLKIHSVPGLPLGYGSDNLHRVKWIEGHYRFVRKVFANDPNFLEYDMTDAHAPQKISAFLGHDLPWWGRANANAPDQVPSEEV